MTQQKTLAGYILEERLAVGGMAEIFRARREGPGGFAKPVAIKRVLPDLNQDPAFVDMFLQEARLVAQLSSPNLVQVFDFGQEDGQYYMVMELVEGVSLATLLSQQISLGFELACHIGVELCRALHHTHSAEDQEGRPLSIVHRDVNPRNVLLANSGDVKLTDFGIAKSRARSLRTQSGTIKGTLSYLSPEQARGDEVDARTDLYCVGLLLYEATTGVRYLSTEGEADLLRRAEQPQWSPPAPELGLNHSQIALLKRAVAEQPERRFASALLLEQALEQMISVPTAQQKGQLQTMVADCQRRLSQPAEPGGPPVPQQEPATPVDTKAPITARSNRPPTTVFVLALGLVTLVLTAAYLVYWQEPAAPEVVAGPVAVLANWDATPQPPPVERTDRDTPEVDATPPQQKPQKQTPALGSRGPKKPRLMPPTGAGPSPVGDDAGHPETGEVKNKELKGATEQWNAIQQKLTQRGLLEADLPDLVAQAQQLHRRAQEGEDVVAQMRSLADRVASFVIDRAFINRKLGRLNTLIRQQNLTPGQKETIQKHTQTALSQSVRGEYQAANRALNKIVAIIQ